jgi:hypothetical protein
MFTIPATEGILSKTRNNNNIKLQCADIDLFRIIQKYLLKNYFDFHTIPFPTAKTIKIVIRGLLPDITVL